jgi:hypothetical protein
MIKKTLARTYQNTEENSTVYVYICTDGEEVWTEERLRQLSEKECGKTDLI